MTEGRVLRAQGGSYDVQTSEGVIQASMRGRLKRGERTEDRIVVGDRVRLDHEGEDWTIEEVHERTSALMRRAPGKANRSKTLVANLDQVIVVFSVAQPSPHLRMLDRFLVLCESSGLDALIVANKVDLADRAEVERLFAPYVAARYRVLYTTTKREGGLEELRAALRDCVSAFTGPSGVGKSSLLNAIEPGLALRVGAVSEAVNKGRHTTVTAQLIPLDCGGFVADTPGLRELGLWGLEPEDLPTCFPEFAEPSRTCKYANSCTHVHEPGCGVREAVEQGTIDAGRYDSYRRMALGEDETWGRPAWS